LKDLFRTLELVPTLKFDDEFRPNRLVLGFKLAVLAIFFYIASPDYIICIFFWFSSNSY